ncbi:Uncharacterised protein [BD1-7 clade bacterium]|uniref:Uncharacterized protein n=1 Tax=BD1-7 clade bacterium TaxID=2029982 RepID=A0A5S9QIV1_9GAMM|nr:Uncharacterised protein [BD1-7 clade bacterium]
MKSYFYPTRPEWFDEELENWKNSGKKYFCFAFTSFTPQTIVEENHSEFWMYLYYSDNRTPDEKLKRVVQYRARVVDYSFDEYVGGNMYVADQPDPKVWFKCETVEELRRNDGSFLTADDFEHQNQDTTLLYSIRTSIAPVNRLNSAVTVQEIKHSLID